MSDEYHFVPFEFPKSMDGKYTALLDDMHVLRSRREQLGLTQQQVAELAGIQFAQYQRLESGARHLSSCSMRIGLSVCAALLLDPYEQVNIDVKQPDESSLKPQVKFDNPLFNPRVGRKQIDRGLMTVYANFLDYCLLFPYDILKCIGNPKFVKLAIKASECRILLIPAQEENKETLDVPEVVSTDMDPIYSIPKFNRSYDPFFSLNLDSQSRKMEAKLVKDESGLPMLLIDLNTAIPTNDLPLGPYISPRCLSR